MPSQVQRLYALGVSAGYAGHQILSNVSLSVRHDEVVALMGESGCGKTTLMKVLAGLITPWEGQVRVESAGAGRLAMMFQSPLLQPWLTVKGNIELPCRIAGVKRDVGSLLQAVGLYACEQKYPGELSGGMQRRVALARALVLDPDALILDEPFSGVDELTKERLYELLSKILAARQIACLFSTHNPYEAVLADRIAIMSARKATITYIHQVALPHPRDEETRQDPQFLQEVTTIRELLLQSQSKK